MSPRIEEIFHAVADLSVSARQQYFIEQKIDAATQQEVLALLEFDSCTSGSTGDTGLRKGIGEAAGNALEHFDQTGDLCGPYRLKDFLGRGGMGTVHLAEREDGEVSQRVAVKLLRPGADDPTLRRRFLEERQILATLSHPNIARLLDAGHRNGQPYLVMEYVEGKPIDVYAAGLNLRGKIALFLKVCAAVGYLHRNLVVHRDLKPQNILVTPDGEPKLLDFGIAKILDLNSDSTVTGMQMLTPDYASPEQVTGGVATTATDVYSLGAVLYKLLTGASPHRFESDSMEAIVTAICKGRITPPSKLKPPLNGDLDMILLKALRKEPEERYSSIEQFAEDLNHYLESRPIAARKGEAWYRTRKFLRRHWMPVAVAVLVTGSLATGLYIANRQRVIAERRFDQLRRLSKRVIDLDGAIHALPGAIDARHKLVAASLEYLEGMSREAQGNVELAQETADGYWRLARIQGVNSEYNLGDHASAEQSLKKADQLMETVLAARPMDRNALVRSAIISQDRMILADTDGRHDDALALARKGGERMDAFLSKDAKGPAVNLEGFMRLGADPRISVAGFYSNQALGYSNQHLYSEAARNARRSVEVAHDAPAAADLRAGALSVLANALRYQGDLEGALRAIQEARDVSERATYLNETSRLFNLYALVNREGLILGETDSVNLGRPGEAIPMFQKALDMMEEAARRDPHDSASRGRLGATARELGNILATRDPKRAVEVFDLGIKRVEEAGNALNTRRDLARLLARSSYPLRSLGRAAEARRRLDRALDILNTTQDYPSQRVRLDSPAYWVVSAVADHQAETGSTRRAIEIYERLLNEVAASNPQFLADLRDAPKQSRMYDALIGLYDRVGETTKAAAMRAKREELWRHWQGELPNNPFVRQQLSASGGALVAAR